MASAASALGLEADGFLLARFSAVVDKPFFFSFGGGSESINTESSLSDADAIFVLGGSSDASDSSVSDAFGTDWRFLPDIAGLLAVVDFLAEFLVFGFGAVSGCSSSLNWLGGVGSASAELTAF